jgi:Zn-dependent protease with chaperone function
MNFFEHQDRARKKTGRLVLLFILAVAAITVAVYFVVAMIWVAQATPRTAEAVVEPSSLWNPQLFALTVLGVGLVITCGSLYRIATLGSGGKDIAEMLGGRLISTGAKDWQERRLLNVVEEMALASGTPVPAVYVMDHESGVNAFAAGFTPTDAVIGVTRGTMEMLTRDELQGVIAHEFSHIFNGDMRLNLRLVGILHGILLISLIGYLMFRIALSVRPSRSSSSDKGGGGGAIVLAILAIGVALYVLGYVGVFFGHLIKSAVSRQREFLADASAVQFTRHPQGIGGALKKIGALGSRLKSAQAEQASHMFFGNGLKPSWFSLTATHPPLDERIRRIEPNFDGDFSKERLPWPEEAREKAALAAAADVAPARRPIAAAVAAAGVSQLSADAAIADVGEPQPKHLEYAQGLLAALPAEMSDEVHDPIGAAAMIFALLLHADPAEDEPELQKLATLTDPEVTARTRRNLAFVQHVPVELRLPLAQLTMSALRQLTIRQFEQFRRAVVTLIHADRRVSLFEYGLHRMILKHLVQFFEPRPPRDVRFETTAAVAGPAAVLLSSLAQAGHPDDPQAAAAAYAVGRRTFDEALPSAPQPGSAFSYTAIDSALNELTDSGGAVKQRLLQACAAVIGHDGIMTIDEAELLRTVADALDCPMPPPAARTG